MTNEANTTTFRHYLLFFLGQQASLLGSSISQFIIIWWITLETQSATYLSIAALAGLAPTIIIMPFAGVLVDRLNRKTIIGVVDFLQALTTVILILLFWSGHITAWLVFLMLALKGACQAFHQPAVNAIIPMMVPNDKLSRTNGLNFLLSGAVALMGPIVAALLLSFARIDQILWIDPFTFVAALVPLLVIRIPRIRLKQEKLTFRKDLLEGISFIRNTKGFMTLTFLATALNFLLTPLSTLLPYYVKFDHLGDVTALAFVMSFFQGGMLAGGLVMSISKGFKKRMAASAFFIYVVFLGYGLLALAPTGLFWLMATGGLIMGLAVVPANVLFQTIFQTKVPIEMQGRVNSVTSSLGSAAQPFGMLISGVSVAFIGTANLFIICTAIGLLTLTLSWLFTDVKHLDTPEDHLHEESPRSQQDGIPPLGES